jgi:hypothetical protein
MRPCYYGYRRRSLNGVTKTFWIKGHTNQETAVGTTILGMAFFTLNIDVVAATILLPETRNTRPTVSNPIYYVTI